MNKLYYDIFEVQTNQWLTLMGNEMIITMKCFFLKIHVCENVYSGKRMATTMKCYILKNTCMRKYFSGKRRPLRNSSPYEINPI